jgi:hypothetical protein
VHVPAAGPHVAAFVSVEHVPVVLSGGNEQHEPLHGCVPSQTEVHVPGVPVAPLHAPELPLGHSVSAVHPHEPPPACSSHVLPMLLPEQDEHSPPPVPHAVCVVPPVQKPVAPPSVISQHPPLHAWLAEHVVTHVFVATSHEKPVWQSAALEQPH